MTTGIRPWAGLVVAIAISGVIACGDAPAPAPESTPAAAQPPPGGTSLAPPVTRAANIEQAVSDSLNVYREDEFNPDARATALGANPATIFAFVRDRIRYEAYAGVLRGADGALAAGAANAFDRSLLLARMLQRHGVPVRFAAAELPPAAAAQLYARMFEGPIVQVTNPAPDNAFWNRLQTRARRDYAVLRDAVGILPTAPAAQAREQALADIQRHVWVQAEIDGVWQDLDSAFSDAVPGRAYVAPRQLVENMPPDWHQTITIRVVADRLEGGAITSAPALTFSTAAVDLIDAPVFITHMPGRRASGGLAMGFSTTMAGPDDWRPVLVIGEQGRAGEIIRFADRSEGGLDAALGAGEISAFVAEWLEVEFAQPGGRREVARRLLTDRASTAWRASHTYDPAALRDLPRDDQGFLAPRAVHNLLFTAGPHDLHAYARSVAWALQRADASDNKTPGRALIPLAVLNFTSVLWSDEIIVRAINDHPAVRLFSDSPRLFIVTHAPGSGGRIEETYDLRRDTLRGVARDASADAVVVERKLRYAALEGALEHEAVARDAAAFGSDATTAVSASGQMTPAGVVALRPGDRGRLSELTARADDIARLTRALDAGEVVVVPRAALAAEPLVYWAVAENGDTRPVGAADLHGGIVSYNPIPRPPPRGGRVWIIPDDPPSSRSQSGSGRAGTEYIGIVIVVVDLISAVSLVTVVVKQRIESANIELEAEAAIADARRRYYAAGGAPR